MLFFNQIITCEQSELRNGRWNYEYILVCSVYVDVYGPKMINDKHGTKIQNCVWMTSTLWYTSGMDSHTAEHVMHTFR